MVCLQSQHTVIKSSSMLQLIDLMEQMEDKLLDLVSATKGRGQKASNEQLQDISAAIEALEALGGVPSPALSDTIEGGWELLYTSRSRFDPLNPLGARVDGSRPGLEGLIPALLRPLTAAASAVATASSSPIQRTVTAIDGVLITQDICLSGPDPRVDQRVALAAVDGAYLRLSAAASVSTAAPERVSLTFDLAYFQAGPLRVPYPVPFRLLGDEARGWLDTPYLSPRLRISRGNKGTTFILRRREPGPAAPD